MAKKIHIHNQDYLGIQDHAHCGWRETKRFGDLVEMELTEYQGKKQRALIWLYKTMLTIKSGIRKGLSWKS